MEMLTLLLGASLAAYNSPYPNCSTARFPRQHEYAVHVTNRNPVPDGGALISHINGTSSFNFSFTTAWFPPVASGGGDEGLIVRVVECNPDHHSCAGVPHPQWTNAGALAVVPVSLPKPGASASPKILKKVDDSAVQWPGCAPPPMSDSGKWGAADPRLTFRPKTGEYYLTWDNCTHNCEPTRSTLLSTTTNPYDSDKWTLHGPVLPGKYTGGAALLFRDDPTDSNSGTHYAFVSDSNTAGSIMLATSTDGIAWTEKGIFMSGREGCWDVAGVATGPQPERLSTGDYLMVYNIDTGFPYRGNPLGRCAVGWAILDKDDPTKVVARSDGPILTATQPWEQCPHKGYTCQETMVVFSTGMKPLGNDEFMVIYGGADTDVGIAAIKVTASKN